MRAAPGGAFEKCEMTTGDGATQHAHTRNCLPVSAVERSLLHACVAAPRAHGQLMSKTRELELHSTGVVFQIDAFVEQRDFVALHFLLEPAKRLSSA